jgi:DNA-binding NarL/FixJ family response regulator
VVELMEMIPQIGTLEHPAPLIGRQRELALLHDMLARAQIGHCRVLLLRGEPGIGKTRLLDAMTMQTAQSRITVLRGGASDADGMPPYLPFLEALGYHIHTASTEALRQQTGPLAAILATILPELILRLGQAPTSYPLPAEQARLRLYEAVGSFLTAIAAPQGLLLVLDDLQWADPASLDLICSVARRQPSARLLLLGAYREGEVEHNPTFQRAIAELNRLRLLTLVSVGRLAEAEITALAAHYLDAPIEPAVSRLLYTQSEGNPFFAEELLRDWLETAVLVRVDGRWQLSRPIETALPSSIAGALRQRLARLPTDLVAVLRTAAISGRTFDTALLAEITGQSLEMIEEHLQEAVRARLIRLDAAGSYTFSHDKIRECLYTEVTTVRRRRLHGRIGEALEARPGGVSAQRLAELAFHFGRSGDHVRGVLYAQRAAEQAMRTYAPEEAMAHYRAALSLIDAVDARRGALSFRLGEAALLAGAEQEAVTALEAAQQWFQQAGDLVAAARAAHRLGQACWRKEAIPAAQTAFETALAHLADRPCPETIQVLVDLGTLLTVNLQRQTEGIAATRQALKLAQQLEDDRLVAMASRAVGNMMVRGNELAAGIPLLERALALAMAIDDPVEAAECCACLMLAYCWQGAWRRALDVTEQWLAFAQRCHDRYQLRHVYSQLAGLYLGQGRLADAERMLDQAKVIVEWLTSPEPRAVLSFMRSLIAYHRGAYAAAEAGFQEAIQLFRAMGPRALGWYLGWLGLSQAAQSHLSAMEACIAEVEALLATIPTGSMAAAEPLVQLTMIGLLLSDRARLARYYPQLTVFRGQVHDVFIVDRLLGEIAALQGDWVTAQNHLAVAEATARREDLLPEVARTLAAQANLELAQACKGSSSRARQLLEQAHDLMEQIGMAGEARRLRERLGRRTPQLETTAHPLPDNLTGREMDVLRLLAAGKSNPEIAAELVLSVRTVERHISNIYAKIGVEGTAARATATAYALRHNVMRPLTT